MPVYLPNIIVRDRCQNNIKILIINTSNIYMFILCWYKISKFEEYNIPLVMLSMLIKLDFQKLTFSKLKYCARLTELRKRLPSNPTIENRKLYQPKKRHLIGPILDDRLKEKLLKP